MFVLAVVDGDDVSAVYRIGRTETVIGRGEQADIVIDDAEISKQHCMIRVQGSVSTIVDLDSLNGTLLNGRRLTGGVSARLRHLDEIDLGNHRLLLLTGRFKPERKTG